MKHINIRIIQCSLPLMVGIACYSMNLSPLENQLKQLLQQLQTLQTALTKFAPPTKPITVQPLQNLGNTCYMNSALQALYNIQPLTRFLIGKENFYPADSLAQKYVELITALQSGNYETALRSFDATTNIEMAALNRGCGAHAQQDATEFLTRLIDSLTSSTKNAIDSYINYLFSFVLQPILYCPQIDKTYVLGRDIGNQLNLPLRDPNTHQIIGNKLEDIVRAFFRPEYNVSYKPEGLATEELCTKAVYIRTLPPFLIISLKRTDNETYLVPVEAPLTLTIESTPNVPGLDRTKIPAAIKKTYELQSALVHIGAIAGGHYVAYVKNEQGNWTLCNDASITIVTEQSMLSDIEKGYAYVYKMRGIDNEINLQRQKVEKSLRNG